MEKRIVLATNNKGKIKEMQRILGKSFIINTMEEVGIVSDPVEDGTTFRENASIKARALEEQLKEKGINAFAMAEDSGLMVATLPFELGVYSARYSGDTNKETRDMSNNKKLIEVMKYEPLRDAKYVASICLIGLDGIERYFEGKMDLIVGTEIMETGNGFAYDFCCVSPEYKKYVCQLTDSEKDKISHRGEALRKMKKALNRDLIRELAYEDTSKYKGMTFGNPHVKNNCVFIIPFLRNAKPYKNYDQVSEEDKQTNVPLVLAVARWDGMLGFVGGCVDDGENLQQAIVREAKEELNYEVDVNRLIPIATFATKSSHIHSFAYELNDINELKLMQYQALSAEHYLAETQGTIAFQVKKYKGDKGLEAMVKNNWCATSRLELLRLIEKEELDM